MLSYLCYLENVLGLRQVILPQAMPSINLKQIDLVFVKSAQPWSKEAKELFDKMVLAMNMSPQQYALISEKSAEAHNAKVAVFFGDQKEFQNLTYKSRVLTFDPELLVEQGSLKRQAWQDLQKAMKLVSDS